MKQPLPAPLEPLRSAWLAAVGAPRRRATIAGVCLAATIAMLVARVGTTKTRLGAVAILAACAIAVVVLRRVDARIFADPARTIRRVAGDVEPELAARAIRALSLLRPEAAKGSSTLLAELHVQRALAALPEEGVRRGAARIGLVFGAFALGLAATNIVACATNPWGVVEGADVLVAKNGVAPLGMAWLAEPQIRARPPDYLHQEERRVASYDETALPRGTLLTVRGTPVHAGRRLLLTDGAAEVPFVDDGSGHVVARWPLADTVKLRVVARFGDVVIPEPEDTPIESIPDKAPEVTLEGAPKRIVLANEEDASEIPIHYDATDDHGLREVHLVLRAAAREERRVLARLDGETKSDRGGYTLRATDPFIKKSHAPVEIRVEAKDNDPITGPKWGASDAIVVVPPDVGEPEAKRLAALVKLRDKLVDSLAWRLSTSIPADMRERRAMLERDSKLSDDDNEALETTIATAYAGVRVSGRLGAMLRGRYRKVKEAVTNEVRSPSTATHAAVVKATERIVLVVDAVVSGLGLKDTREVARELADVADDLAVASQLTQKPAEKQRGEQRIEAAVMVLEGGERSMKRLGSLGRDLGEIVEMDLSRFARARKAEDMPHGALVAQDLAARLRQPDPSFGARGGRPSHAGGESGGGRGAPGAESDGEGSDVEQAFNEAAQDLEKLAAEHAGNMGRVEQSLAGGSSEEDAKQLSEEAKKHAQKVREAAKPLPQVGGGSDSWTSKGAAAREHAEQMAKAMEEGNAADAVQSGRSAMGALDEAKRAAQRERWGRFSDTNAERTVDEAKKGLEQELRWAEEKLEEMRKKAAQRAGPELREHGENEGKLADKARDLGKKGHDQEALPPNAIEALREAERAAREAARALREGDAERGLSKQREAQQKLEQAREALGDQEQERGEGEGERGPSQDHADIPKAEQHRGPEEFRKRVIKGLGQPSSGRLKDAVKRYAEGLLR
jgi:predicted aconitase with swiveling domain